MPLQIVRQDITKMDCDAIVNPSNENLIPGGGVDAAIHFAAGSKLAAACEKLGGCNVGEAKLTRAFNLPAKYVIHTVGPVWQGGNHNEKKLLISCYIECLKLAESKNLSSIAFPLISSGTFGYPKDQVLKIAMECISSYLRGAEMLVYLVVYDKQSYEFSKRLSSNIKRYIAECDGQAICRQAFMEPRSCKPAKEYYESSFEYAAPSSSLEDVLCNLDESFAEALFRMIDEKGISDVECYKKANIDKKTFSKIKCNKNYKPSKSTVLSFAIALELTIEETDHLLETVGFTLSHSSKFDLIIEYFIKGGNYNIFEINEALFEFDQPCLGTGI